MPNLAMRLRVITVIRHLGATMTLFCSHLVDSLSVQIKAFVCYTDLTETRDRRLRF